jgi:hypothetical protein
MEKEKIQAIMNVGKDEQIAGMWISKHIAGTGYYKLLAKEKNDGTCEWVHFIQRDNGNKEKLYSGDTKNSEELKLVLQAINAVLAKTFGSEIQLGEGNPNIYTTDGIKAGKEIN